MNNPYWRVVLDYGTRREYIPVHSSEFAANLIANNYRLLAKANHFDAIAITVERVVVVNNIIRKVG